jgi:hypothetical protein
VVIKYENLLQSVDGNSLNEDPKDTLESTNDLCTLSKKRAYDVDIKCDREKRD